MSLFSCGYSHALFLPLLPYFIHLSFIIYAIKSVTDLIREIHKKETTPSYIYTNRYLYPLCGVRYYFHKSQNMTPKTEVFHYYIKEICVVDRR
jgi:hypothetical protein